jgi:hypothetical protein
MNKVSGFIHKQLRVLQEDAEGRIAKLREDEFK